MADWKWSAGNKMANRKWPTGNKMSDQKQDGGPEVRGGPEILFYLYCCRLHDGRKVWWSVIMSCQSCSVAWLPVRAINNLTVSRTQGADVNYCNIL